MFLGKYELKLKSNNKIFADEYYDKNGNKIFINLKENEYFLIIKDDEKEEVLKFN